MNKSKTLPTIRITDYTDEIMKKANNKLNEDSIVQISFMEFRRLCYIFASKWIIEGKELPKITQM